jgi:hypothetical protein
MFYPAAVWKIADTLRNLNLNILWRPSLSNIIRMVVSIGYSENGEKCESTAESKPQVGVATGPPGFLDKEN